MQSRHWNRSLLSGLMLFILSGCYSYQPYGPAGYPGYYPTPQPGIAPQPGQYISPGPTPQLGTPTFNEPQPVPNSDIPNGNWQETQPSDSGAGTQTDTPFFDPNDAASAAPDRGGYVPDPANVDAPPLDDQGSNNDRFSPFFEGGAASIEPQQNGHVVAMEPIPQAGRDNTVHPVPQAGGADDDDSFQKPTPITLTSASSESALPATNSPENAESPYDHDNQHFHWLRGKVEYDRQDGQWHLMYDKAPDVNDQLGGEIALVDNEQLDSLKNNDIVLVQGHVDRRTRDAYGKPSYRIHHIDRLVRTR